MAVRQPLDPDDAFMWAWLQQERRHAGFLPHKVFRDIGKVLTFRVKSLENAKKHAAFSRKHGMRVNSQAQFARNTMFQIALIETQGNLSEAAEILKVSPSTISTARLGMHLGAEFLHRPNAKFDKEDVLAMSPMPEIRLTKGPQNLFDRFSKIWPEAIHRARNLLGFKLTDTAVFLLMDLVTRTKQDRPLGKGERKVKWAFHIFSDPSEWLARTSLSKGVFYRALKQLRDAGFLFRRKHRHWVIAFQGPMFKWLCQQGFVSWEALANKDFSEAMTPQMTEDAAEALVLLADVKDYQPLKMNTRVRDYFEYVFASVRRTFAKIRDVTVQVFSRTKRLLDNIGFKGEEGQSNGSPCSGPDPGLTPPLVQAQA